MQRLQPPIKLKTEGLERLAVIKSLFNRRAHNRAGQEEAPRTRDYLKQREEDLNEMMGIRFTSGTIERLCDSVRGMVEEVRACEAQDSAYLC
ncbi:MAG: sigma-70 non-essential region-containing protein [Propionivibrio sp.]|nr:sigma-70 non-essential region-containing protein [Propionivibrio sp.]